MQNFGANVASCDEDVIIRFANKKALEIIVPEQQALKSTSIGKIDSVDGTNNEMQQAKQMESEDGGSNPTFSVEFFHQTQEKAPSETQIESKQLFVPYLVSHKSVKRFFEDRE